MQPVQIKEGIYWVGGIDWHLRDFHGYKTPRGSTYNAYLIVDDKITLVDTVKHYLADEMLTRISDIVDPAKINCVVCNHVEMDHSGSLPVIMNAAPDAVIITSPQGQKGLNAHYKNDWDYEVINSGDKIPLGKRSLQFVHTPMVHWPDNMVTYMPEEQILFSNDAFGQHIASAERFDDEFLPGVVLEEARKYYANIVLPYGRQVQAALESLKGLDLKLIAPSHGLMWRSHIPEIIGEYQKWMVNAVVEKAVVVYDSMWDSTGKIARAIEDAFETKKIKASLYSLQNTHPSDIMTQLIDAKYICVGSPTLNNNMLPSVAAFLTYLKGLAPKDRVGLAFGSYGWGGQSIQQVEDVFKTLGFTLFNKIKLNYVPDTLTLQEIRLSVERQL